MAKRSDKRERLINAAKELFYKQGFNNTTIADIAKLADVPLGNVYYYFKTKDEICAAVIKEYHIDMTKMINDFNAHTTAQEKLNAMIDFYADLAEEVAKYGNIFSSLIQELAKLNNPLITNAKEILGLLTTWLKDQFKSFYNEDTANNKAIEFLSKLQGIQSLTLAFQDKELMIKQIALLKSEVNRLALTEAA